LFSFVDCSFIFVACLFSFVACCYLLTRFCLLLLLFWCLLLLLCHLISPLIVVLLFAFTNCHSYCDRSLQKDLDLLIVKHNLSMQFVENMWLKHLALYLCPRVDFPFKK
jgi:hypothetical protein